MPNAGSRVAWPSMPGATLPGRNRQFAALRQLVARDLDALQRNHVFAAAQRQIVGDAHRRQQVAEVAAPVAGGSPRCGAAAAIPARPPPVRPAPARLRWPAARRAAATPTFSLAAAGLAAARRRCRRPRSPCCRMRQPAAPAPPPSSRNGIFGMPGSSASAHQHAARQQQRLRVAEDLLVELRAQPRFRAGAGDDQAARNRDHQRRNDRHQAVADRQDGVGLERLAASPCRAAARRSGSRR